MRRGLLGSLLVAWCLVAGAMPFDQLLYKGRAEPFYGAASTPMHQRMSEVVQRTRLAERMAKMAGAVRLRRDLLVGFESCAPGQSAHYDPGRVAIVICYDLLELIGRLARSDEALMQGGKEAFARVIDGAIWGIYFHELAHAVININRVPITGREEDVADQFAVYIATVFVEPSGVPVVVPTMWLFQQLAKQRDLSTADQQSAKTLLSSEHSLDGQRVFNLACWGYGAGGAFSEDAALAASLPRERAVRCRGEYAALHRGINVRFQKYLKVRAQ